MATETILGAVAPAPAVAARMRLQKEHDTAPELALRRALFRRRLRFRVHFRPLVTSRREADIAFPRRRVAVFVDGCFWHGCQEHRTMSKTNSAFWALKIAKNVQRDRDTDATLASAGWRVVRVWEHADVAEAAGLVAAALQRA